MTLQDNILKNYDKLSETDLYIIDYIKNNKKQIENLTINELAKNTNVSNTTILRFTNKIGLEGYSELKYILKNENEQEKYYSDFNDFEKACDSFIKYISEIKLKNYSRMFQLLNTTGKIFVWGSGDIQRSVAKYFSRMMLSCGKLVYLLQDREIDKDIFELIQPNDTVVIISLSGKSKHTLDFAKRLKLQKANIISITEFKNNDLTTISDESLYISSSEINMSKNHPNFKTTSLYFILIELLAIKLKEYQNIIK